MKLGMQIGLDPCHIVLDGDPAPSHKGAQRPPIFGPYLLWPSGWIDQEFKMTLGREVDGSSDIVLDGDAASPLKKGQSPSRQFSAHVYCGQTAVCIRLPLGTEVGLSLGDIVLDGDPAHLP